MPGERRDESRIQDGDLQRYLTARAESVARRAAAPDTMTGRVAASLGLVQPARSGTAWLLRVGVVVALLALVVVALGIGNQPPQPSPSPTPVVTPRPSAPSPAPLSATGSVAIAAAAIEVTADQVWVIDTTGLLAELDPSGGAVLRSVQLAAGAADLLVTADSVWVASPDADLVRVDLGNLATTAVAGARGGALSEGADAIWLGSATGVARINPGTNAIDLTLPVENRGTPSRGVAAFGDAVWVATETAIVRLAAADGTTTGRVPGDATSLSVADGSLWATRGTELVRIDLDTAEARSFIPGLPGQSLAAADGRLWVAGPGGGGASGTIVGIGSASELIELSASLESSVLAVAAGAGGVWVAGDDGRPIYRFSAP